MFFSYVLGTYGDLGCSERLNRSCKFGVSVCLTNDRLATGTPVWKQSLLFAFFSYVSGAEINFKLLLIKFVPPSLGQQTVPANKTKHTGLGKPNKWKPRKEKLGLACIRFVRMPFGNTHTPGPFEYLSPLYGPTLGRHNEADALRKKRRVWFFIYAQWIPALSF